MKIMQVLTVALLAKISEGAQKQNPQIDPAVLGHARYGLVFANSRGICDEWDPAFKEKRALGNHQINDIKEMKALHFLGHGLVHTRAKHDNVQGRFDADDIHKFSPKDTRGSLENASLSSAQYNTLMDLINRCLGRIGQEINQYKPDVQKYWAERIQAFQGFMKRGKAGQILARDIAEVDADILVRYARFGILVKLTRGVCMELQEVMQYDPFAIKKYTANPNGNLMIAYRNLSRLGNSLCHNICRPVDTMSQIVGGCSDGQIEVQTYNFFLFEIRRRLETLQTDDTLSAYMKQTLKFIEMLPPTLNIKRQYPDLDTFKGHSDNEGFRFNFNEGRIAKIRAVIVPHVLTAEQRRAQEEAARKKAAPKAVSPPTKQLFGKSPKSGSESSSSDSSDDSSSAGSKKSLPATPRSSSPETSVTKTEPSSPETMPSSPETMSSSPETRSPSPGFSSGDEKIGYSSGSETLESSSNSLLESPLGKNLSKPIDLVAQQLAKLET